MDERERLIELLKYQNCPSPMLCDKNCKYAHLEMCYEERTADYLLANGVIVPPCKVGDTVYCIEYRTVREAIVKQVKSLQDEAGTKFFVQVECEFEDPFFDDKRKTKHGIYAIWEIEWGEWHRAFSTREEAEAALAERSEG